jgi:hypothetical protein
MTTEDLSGKKVILCYIHELKCIRLFEDPLIRSQEHSSFFVRNPCVTLVRELLSPQGLT